MRLLLHPAGAKAWNMAVDEALLRQAHEPLLRLYGWEEPALSLGYFQRWDLVPPGHPFVRRYTGGGVVDHAGDFTYTLIFPHGHRFLQQSIPESYAEIHRQVAQALQSVGLPAELTVGAEDMDSTNCFQKAVKYDVTIAGKKVAGAAQRRTREGMLQQGSILLGNVEPYAALREALPSALAPLDDTKLVASELTRTEEAAARQLEHERYSTVAWNQRR